MKHVRFICINYRSSLAAVLFYALGIVAAVTQNVPLVVFLAITGVPAPREIVDEFRAANRRAAMHFSCVHCGENPFESKQVSDSV
ncbi:hypothetical protein GCM10010280_65150 [Streptomyces pilosus]|uniref:Uncharacterized protein n=1 Tax=Streptomyces pilosus TaxID=28893 RepID=A0A918C5R3_9ACTN|nr:hypothetical protein GCM10010280_65150 [Streptomyces pilosus]